MKTLLVLLFLFPLLAQASDWSLVGGAGQANFKWCADDGCWHQNPLPYWDDRSGAAVVLGARYNLSDGLAVDLLHHALPTVRAGGTYVPDDGYNPDTQEVTATWTYETNMLVRTKGYSISVVPKKNFGDFSVFGRVGALWYMQTTYFISGGETVPYFIERGSNITWILGTGLGYKIGNVTISAEFQAFPRVKVGQSPIGGDWKNDKSEFGLVSYLLMLEYRI